MLGNLNRGKGLLEAVVGVVVIIAIVVLSSYFFIEVKRSGMYVGKDCYNIKTAFTSVDGLERASLVKISGITVGKVTKIQLANNFQAVLDLCIMRGISIPSDSTASIVREGFISNKYLKIDPGIDSQNLAEDDFIKNTQSSINIESLIGKLILGNK